MRITYTLMFCSMLSISSVAMAESSWALFQERQNVRVEYRKSADNLLQIRATTTVISGIGAFLHLLEDTASIRNWLSNSHSSSVLTQPDQYTHIVHTRFNAVWPISPRDMITRSVWSQHAETRELTIQISDIGQQYPTFTDHVRIQQVQGEWTLTPLPQGQLRITYQGQADLSGRLPHVLVKNVALKSTAKTFDKLSKVLPNYQRTYLNIIE